MDRRRLGHNSSVGLTSVIQPSRPCVDWNALLCTTSNLFPGTIYHALAIIIALNQPRECSAIHLKTLVKIATQWFYLPILSMLLSLYLLVSVIQRRLTREMPSLGVM